MKNLFCVGIKVEKYQRQVLDNKTDAPSKIISSHELWYLIILFFEMEKKPDR